jgi:hypothetical protein
MTRQEFKRAGLDVGSEVVVANVYTAPTLAVIDDIFRWPTTEEYPNLEITVFFPKAGSKTVVDVGSIQPILNRSEVLSTVVDS